LCKNVQKLFSGDFSCERIGISPKKRIALARLDQNSCFFKIILKLGRNKFIILCYFLKEFQKRLICYLALLQFDTFYLSSYFYDFAKTLKKDEHLLRCHLAKFADSCFDCF